MPERRGTSRLLALDRATGATECTVVSDLPRLLDPGDLLVVNDTRVFPAGLLGMTGHIGLTRFAGAEGPRLLSPSTSLGASTI